MNFGTLMLSGLILGFSLSPFEQGNSRGSIEGAWRVAEVQSVLGDGRTKTAYPKESLVIISDGFYSFCWAAARSYTDTWQMPDSEKVARFNSSLVNTGRYTVTGSILEMHPQLALYPKFVGGTASFRYSFSGDTLVLTGITVESPDGVRLPLYVQGGHTVSKLIRVKR